MALMLRTSLLVALSVATLPILAVLSVTFAMWADSEYKIAETKSLGSAKLLNRSLEGLIEESRRDLEGLATDPTFRWENVGESLARLKSYANRYSFSRGIFWFDPTGAQNVEAGMPRGVSVNDRQWFQQVVRTKQFTIGEFIRSRISGIPSMPMATPILKNGQLVGILGMSIDLNWLYSLIEAETGVTGTTVTLVSRDAIELVRYPNPEKYVGKKFPQPQALNLALAGQDVASQFAGLDRVVRLYSIQPLRLNNMIVGAIAVGIPVDEIHRGTQVVQGAAWASVGLLVTLCLGFLVFGMRGLVLRPVSQLAEGTRTLAKGNFAFRIDGQKLPKELALLAASINSLASSLEARDRELKEYQGNLEQMVEQRTAELEASKEDLARSNADLQQFAYVASHDLQEPLRMVASFTQLLERKFGDKLDEQGKQYIQFAVDGATRMQQLINDLLTYSRAETQAKELTVIPGREPVDLALKNLTVLIEEKGAAVEVGDIPAVLADRGQLTQVFQNLIANGIKFNRSQTPKVIVEARATGRFVEISVTDNGIGIDPQFADRIFVIFQRLNPRGEFGGTGIGLAVCKKIVERHGGKIWMEPREVGSRFVFTLKTKN